MRKLSLIVLLTTFACSEYTVDKPAPSPDVTGTDVPTQPPATEPPPTEPPPSDAPDIEVTPDFVPFGFLPPACASAPEPVTITNVGNGTLEVTAIGWVDDVGAFDHDGVPLTLAPGDSTQLELSFLAPTDGDFTDALRIESNDPDEGEVLVVAEGSGAASGLITESFDQVVANMVDVLFVLDNSGSMSDNIDELAARFPNFIDNFVALGLDYQIGVVTTDMDDPAQSGQILGPIITDADPDPVGAFVNLSNTGATGSGDERGLDAVFAALDPSQGLITTTNAGLLRPGSNLSVIVVSDEDDGSGGTPAQFVAWLNQLQGDPDLTSLSIIGGPRQGFFPCIAIFSGTSADPVPRYWNVARNTGGLHGDLCSPNFGPILTQLSSAAAGLRTTYALQNAPDPATIVVEVDGVPLAENGQNGWTYDAAVNQIVFHGTGVPAEGTSVQIRFEGETVCP